MDYYLDSEEPGSRGFLLFGQHWIKSDILSDLVKFTQFSIEIYLVYFCFIRLQAQKVPSLTFWHLITSENVPSPFLFNIRYSI